jgi:hypothetical protein
MRKLRTFLMAVAVLASACAGTSATAGGFRPTSELTADDALVFEDGVDFVADPDALDGQWRDNWNAELRHRMDRSDVVAVVEVSTLRTDEDPSGHTTLRVIVAVNNVFKGSAEGDIELLAHAGSVGYSSVERGGKRMLEQSFVAFVKWYATDTGMVAAHWHLSPASPSILAAIQSITAPAQKSTHQIRVIEHKE